MKIKSFAYILTLPVTIVLFLLGIFPLIYLIYMSFASTASGLQHLFFVGFKNYKEIFLDSTFLASIKNTFIFIIGTVCTTTIVGFFIALLLHDIKRGISFFRVVFILPLAIAPVVTGLTFGMMLNPTLGIINYLISFLRIPPIGWATETSTALLSVILVDTWQWTPFMMLIIYAGLQSIPIENYESARIDGANRLQEIIYITIPLLKPILIIALIFRFMDAFRTFDIIYVITKGGPGTATMTMVLRAYLLSFKFFRPEISAAISIILLIISIIVTKNVLKFLPK